MKEKRNFLVGVVLGLLLGWTMGFVRMPFIDKNASFWVGFLACLSLLALMWMGIFIWKKNSQLFQFFKDNSDADNVRGLFNANALVWFCVTIIIMLSAIFSVVSIYNQSTFLKKENEAQKALVLEQAQVLEATKSANLTALMHQLFDKMDAELKENPTRRLSEETIERLVALNYSFRPRKFWKSDRLSEERLSPERGQLLLLLAKLDLDTSSFEAIKQKISFHGADLRKVNLSGINLSGIDLSKANMSEAVMNAVDLRKANLKEAKLWGAKLNQANFSEAILNNADLKWAELNEGVLNKAIFNGSDLRDAKLRMIVADSIDLGWSKVNGALLDRATLTNGDLTGAELGRANLLNANFTGSNLKLCNFSEANLEAANMTGVDLGKATTDVANWFEKLIQWQVKGAKEIQENYEISKDVAGQYNYRLRLKEQ